MKLLLSFMLSACAMLNSHLSAQTNGQLVIFIQDGRSISQDFKRNTLPEIKKLSKEKNLELKVVDASEGAPIEVAYTPAIFYRTEENSTLFQGRYSDLSNLKKFIASAGKTQPAPFQKTTELLAWNIGRATLNTTMKINPLSGTPPRRRKFDAQKFENEARASILKGMEFFQSASTDFVNGPSKAYHMEFYPEVKEGVLLVHMELYSASDLRQPVFKTDIPSGSDRKHWEDAFEKAGNRLEKALVAQISNWDNGDGFDTLKETTPVCSWSESLAFRPARTNSMDKKERIGKE